ncbi:hypothetical protein [Emcibacter sp. SYSU 3D8]|uniref:hypothetical protein n=1 Tax=Emcibacter sp. SYSU 3D8 TaxID=3133969 RepID=UPI0031FF3A98
MKMLWALLIVPFMVTPVRAGEGAAQPAFDAGGEFLQMVDALARLPEPSGLLGRPAKLKLAGATGLPRVTNARGYKSRPCPVCKDDAFNLRGRDTYSAMPRFTAYRVRPDNRLKFAFGNGQLRYGLWSDVREVNNVSTYDNGTPPVDGYGNALPVAASARPAEPPVNFSFAGGASNSDRRSYTEYRGGIFMSAPF